ncbi:MAG: hypothetical protein J6T19_05325 [Paludibacteraceae bacterium]|nr:hypothetical protein [Paludibacteraceae bacterium]
MKSIKFFAVASAVALLSTTGFTSCNQKNAPDGPGNLKDGEVVKTQFSIAIPGVNSRGAQAAPDVYRMPAANTQDEASQFLGMDNIVLMPFITDESGDPGAKVSDDVVNASTTSGPNIFLSNVGGTGAGNISPTGLSGTAANYKVYSNVELPEGTNHFLFYAHGTTPASTFENDFKYGALIVDGMNATTPGTYPTSGAISFSHKQIYAGGDTKAAAIATYLTTIANAEWVDNNGTPDDASDDVHHPWATYENTQIKAFYDAFITLKAGSSNSVLAALEDLYNSMRLINEAYKPAHASADEPLVANILTAITAQVDVDVDAVTRPVGEQVLTWKTSSACKGYPQNIHLPDGAAAVAWGTPTANAFNVANTYTWAAANNGSVSLNIAPCTDYVYPSCIYYYVNSGLKTSQSSQVANYGTQTWTQIITNQYAGTDNIAVATNTRSVAIEKPIQYGVARMKTKVKAHGASIKDYANADIPVENLEMTAVLVGGQGPVGFNFSPISGLADATYYKHIVYDTCLTAGEYHLNNDHTTYTATNPTLVLESKKDSKILIAVEFLNHGDDFYGAEGQIIPKGTHFYVVAELDPTTTNTDKTEPASGTGSPDNCVFKQDHTTFVNLTLRNLSKAYNLVPDLRSLGLEIGFSVDLNWQSGYTFDIEI